VIYVNIFSKTEYYSNVQIIKMYSILFFTKMNYCFDYNRYTYWMKLFIVVFKFNTFHASILSCLKRNISFSYWHSIKLNQRSINYLSRNTPRRIGISIAVLKNSRICDHCQVIAEYRPSCIRVTRNTTYFNTFDEYIISIGRFSQNGNDRRLQLPLHSFFFVYLHGTITIILNEPPKRRVHASFVS